MSRRVRPSRAHVWFPRLHRWLGIGSLVFVLLLSATGVALNHTTGLSLDQRYVSADWLLRWYGIDVPSPTASFTSGGHTVALIGERIYFDEIELADGAAGLVGAAAASTHITVATPSRVLLVAPNGRLIEQIAVTGTLPGDIAGFGLLEGDLIYESEGRLYRSDQDVLDIAPWMGPAVGKVEWSRPSVLSPERLEVLGELYRGRGLSLERLLLDLHSGRAFSRAGPWLMDVVGVALVALSLFGLLLWMRRQRLRRPRG